MTLLALAISFLFISSAHSHQIRRIIGGKDSDIIKHPYQVQIVPVPKKTPQDVLFPSCSGAIVGSNVVLTAGHCTRKGNHHPNMYYIRAGTSYRSGKGGSLHRIIAIRVHKDYLASRRAHSKEDISIIFVDPPFVFDKTRRPAPIALTAANEGDFGIVSGWGYSDTNRKVHPKTLQSTGLMIITGETCNKYTKWSNMIGEYNFCAGGDGLKSTCKGDSGSPIVLEGRVVGIVSWGSSKNCGKFGYPTVFTNVTKYIPWIKVETAGSDLTYV